MVERSKFPELENEEYYQSDLIGCEVFGIDSDYRKSDGSL